MKKLPLFCLLLAIALGLTALPPSAGAAAPLAGPGVRAAVPAAQIPTPASSGTPAPAGTVGAGIAASGASKASSGASLLASQVLRYPILDVNGNEIGQLVNLLIDTDDGCVRHAVITYSGGAGLTGERALAIPIELLSVDQAQGGLDLNVDPDTLSDAPSFPRFSWPDVSTPGWEQTVRRYWENFGAAGAATDGSDCSGSQTTGSVAGTATIPHTADSPTPSPTLAIGETVTRAIPIGTGPGSAAAGATAAGTSVAVALREYTIDMPASLPAGATRFVVTNTGARPHNLVIAGQGLEQEFARNLEPGETRTMDITLGPGSYSVYCPSDNPSALGMWLTLTVTVAGTPGPAGNALGNVVNGTGPFGVGTATSVPFTPTSANGTAAPPVWPSSAMEASTGTAITVTPPAAGLASSALESASGMLVRLSQFPAYTIVSRNGQHLGRVTDFVLDPVTWHISYVVVSPLGGLLSFGGPNSAAGTATPRAVDTANPAAATLTMLPPAAAQRLILVPWTDLTVDNARMAFKLNAAADALDQAPAFTARNWPNMSRPGWDSASRGYWEHLGVTPEVVPGPSQPVGEQLPARTASPGALGPPGDASPPAR
jgi:sporulation protein YlmC with PRC-barrel domain